MGSNRHPAERSGKRGRSLVVENCQNRVRLSLSDLERFLFRINRELHLDRGSVFVRLISDLEMRRLNKQFRSKRKTTDVLSFPFESRTRPRALRSRAKQLRGAFLGDIAISPMMARRNGRQFGRTMPEEIRILMLHGVLHLLGYDHETDGGEMERVERALRNRLGLS
jgi:probable rRNA maturation factor